jgi:hypothetical protein
MKMLLMAMLFLTVSTTPLLGQAFRPPEATASIEGKAVDDSGAIIAQARAALLDLRTLELQRAVADNNGHFTFGEIRPGTYELIVAPPDRFSCVESAVRRLRLKAKDIVTPTVTLTFRKCKSVE